MRGGVGRGGVSRFGRGLVLAVLAGLATPLLAQVVERERPANGLIVKLRDAPASPRAQALSAGRGDVDLDTARLQRVLGAAGFVGLRSRPVGRAGQHLDFGRVLGGADAERLAAQLRQQPEVEWVVPNERERRLGVTPSDPYFAGRSATQWWLANPGGSNANALDARLRGLPGFQNAWALEKGRPGAVVAVLDSGITNHPDLAGHVLAGYDFVSRAAFANDGDGRDADPSDPGDFVTAADKASNPTDFADCAVEDSTWHGTQIAGLVAALTDNAVGVAATSWDGRVLPVRVAGKCGAYMDDIIDGMYWAAGLSRSGASAGVPINPNPARIVSLSFGSDAPCNPAYQSAISDLAARGVVVVVAAGNDHTRTMRPANCNGAIGVAALNRDGFKATYSNFGAELTIATVGGDPQDEGAWGALLGDDGLLTLDGRGARGPEPGAYYASVFGSSYAAPLVAGAVSLMLSANPNLSHGEIVAGLRLSARPHVTSPKIGVCSANTPGRCICTTGTCGAGILDVAEAVRYAQTLLAGAVFTPRSWPTEVIANADVDAAVALGPDLPPNRAEVADSGGGGGALGLPWLFALALSVIAAGRVSRRPA